MGDVLNAIIVVTHLRHQQYCYRYFKKQAVLTIQRIFRSWNQKRINSAKIIQRAVIKWLYRPDGSFMKQAKDRYYQRAELDRKASRSTCFCTTQFLTYTLIRPEPNRNVRLDLEEHLRSLIDERKNRNSEYHNIVGNRMDFWDSVSSKINEQFRTAYTGYNCKSKFQNLVRDHNLMCQYMAGNKSGRRSKVGERYFEEFRAHFWERPQTTFDLVHNANIATRRAQERRRNRTPPPTYEEVLSMLSYRESPAGQRDRSASPTRRVPSRRVEVSSLDNASNIANETREAEASLLRNSDISPEINLGHNDSSNLSSNLTNITRPNISLSRNESDISMQDVGGSQPLSYMESINEEER
ncbi:hypothetical protein Glove_167g40 [Diversispora epigaea]|uniref:Uncharacterized protein n=1 Tax=Diversispora epigaea TaxID=1348612 RepID=A0A397IWK9_9GLOM|nr:hypothetical protein Glove_167g40 [Diversispora epigaea]